MAGKTKQKLAKVIRPETKQQQTRKRKQKPNEQPKRSNKSKPNDNGKHEDILLRETKPVTESHHIMSSMIFDGTKLITKIKKDNEPEEVHEYTKDDLKHELPIGNKMVDDYLDGEMPEELQKYQHQNPVFTNVLISPVDLGLMPPDVTSFNKKNRKMMPIPQQRRIHRLQCLQRQLQRENRKKPQPQRLDAEDGVQLIINDDNNDYNEGVFKDNEYNNRQSYTRRRRHVKPKILFHLK